MNIKYKNLFSPITVNKMVLKNRIIAAPIVSHISREKVTSGVSMAIIGCGFINEEHANVKPREYMFSKYNLEETRKKLEFYRQGGAKVSLELMHAGMYAGLNGNDYVYGPCNTIRDDGVQVKGMNLDDMEKVAAKFAEAAVDAKEMGFDMIILHFAHGWLITQFLSPSWNKRKDEFGGSIENRIKFPMMIIKTVREAVGDDFPIDIRLNGHDWVYPSIQLDDAVYFAKQAEKYIDMIHITAGTDINREGNVHMATTSLEEHCVNINLSKKFKENLNIPITVVGGIETPAEAENIISNGYADCVALGRGLVADPLWAKKALDNRENDIVPCLRCLYCFHISTNHKCVGCAVNPRYNKEDDYPLVLEKAKYRKKVVIIGGGPAGMKAALTCAERGHEVILLEKSASLGGALKCADYDEYKRDLKKYKDYLIYQVGKSSIEVRTGIDVTKEYVEDIKPDAIMIAVGAHPITPKIPGVNSQNVIQAVDAYPILNSIKDRVVIIGGGTIGCELGLELAKRRKNVTIIEMTGMLNSQANMLYKVALRQHMNKYENLRTILNTTCIEIRDNEVITSDYNKNQNKIECDQVILAVGMKPNRELANSFYGIVPDTYILGDCNKVARVKEATEDAYYFSLNV